MCVRILIGLFGVTVPNGLVRLYLLFSVLRLAVFIGYILAGLNLGSNGAMATLVPYAEFLSKLKLVLDLG